MDPLAFGAKRVFKLADGSDPMERELEHEPGGQWSAAHSSYWEDAAFHSLAAQAYLDEGPCS